MPSSLHKLAPSSRHRAHAGARLIGCLFIAAMPFADVHAAEPTKTPKAEKKPAKVTKGKSGAEGSHSPKTPTPAADGGGALGQLQLLLPIGRSSDGVTIPQTDETGQLSGLMRMAKVTHRSEGEFFMESLRFVSYDTEAVPTIGLSGELADRPISLSLEVPHGVYHLANGSLESDAPCKITRPEFVMTGDSLLFYQKEKVGQMRGHVRMIIHGSRPAATTPHTLTPSPK
jgi:hypothetical protein